MSQARFGNIFDLDNYTDAAKSVADSAWDGITSVADAGHFIGGLLKGISPALSFVPGIGTGLAVAFYAAGGIAAADPITDIVIGTASAAMPPGLPRIGFDGAAAITKDIANGNNAWESAIDAMRKVAGSSGPQAQAAFDAALNMARGGKVDPRLLAEAKASFANGGTTASMAFDAGVAIANGEGADQVVLDVARNYIRDAGGPVAAAAFDTGVALGYGQTLQEAGWAGLHTLVRGNDVIEMILNFVSQVGLAKAAGIAVPEFLANGMVRDATESIRGALPALPDFDKIKSTLDPYVKVFQDNLPALQIPSGELAKQWGLDEAVVRAAQSLVDQATGKVNDALLNLFNVPDAPGMKERNDALAKAGQDIAAHNGQLGIARSQQSFLRTPAWMRGFDIALAICAGSTQWGPGQSAVRDSIPTEDQYNGFNFGRDLTYKQGLVTLKGSSAIQSQVAPTAVKSTTGLNTAMSTISSLGRSLTTAERTTLVTAAARGAQIASATPTVAAVRKLIDDGNYRWGFDVATSICQGSAVNGPGQDRYCSMVGPFSGNGGPTEGSMGSNTAVAGFRAAQALQFGITKGLNGPPAVTAGNLMVQGLIGSGLSPAQKAGVVSTTLNNSSVAAGAAAAVKSNTGFFAKILAFFGL